MFQRVLVAVDGYAPSLGAAKKAVEIASRDGSEVVAVQVEEELPLLPEEKNAEAVALKGAGQEPLAAEPLDTVAAFGRKHGVAVKTVKKVGRVTATILSLAKEVKSDLIIVGDSGRKGLQKLYFGSVAQAVAEHAPCPVLIVKKDTVDITDLLSVLPKAEAPEPEAPVSPVFQPAVFRRNLVFAGGLLALYALVYFGSALLTSAPFKDTAALEVLGLPLAIWLGWITFVSGVVVVRIFLARSNHKGAGSHG